MDDQEKAAIVAELWRRRDTLDPEKRAIVQELANRFALPKTGALTAKAPVGLAPETPEAEAMTKKGLEVFGPAYRLISGKNEANPQESATSTRLGAASSMLRDVGSYAAPLLAPAMVAAPVATVGSLMAAGGAGKLAGAGARALGAGQGTASAAEDVGALLGGGVAARYLPGMDINPLRLNTGRAANRVFRPLAADSDFPEIAPGAFSDVKTYGSVPKTTVLGNPRVRVGDLMAKKGESTATSEAIKTLQEEGLEPWLDRARKANVKVPGDAVVEATRSAIPDLMWTKDPQGAAAIMAETKAAFGGKEFTTDQFRSFLKTENGSLAPFYSRALGAQNSTIAAGNAPAIEQAQASVFRNKLYEYLDPENGGAGPREIQLRTGAVRDLQNAATRKANQVDLEKPDTVAGGFVKPIKAAVQMVYRNVGEPPAGFLHPWEGPSDATVTNIYRQVPEAAPLPKPQGSYYSTQNNPERQLPPASTIILPSQMAPGMPAAEEVAHPPFFGSTASETRPAGVPFGTDVRPRALLERGDIRLPGEVEPPLGPYMDWTGPMRRQAAVPRLGPGTPKTLEDEIGSRFGDILGPLPPRYRALMVQRISDLMQGAKE